MTISVLSLLTSIVALVVVVFQTRFTGQALAATRSSIEASRIQRQLEILPKYGWVITVQVALKSWTSSLEERVNLFRAALASKSPEDLVKVAGTGISKPQDLDLHPELYKSMPPWLRELWISGAQYFFDAIISLPSFCKMARNTPESAEDWFIRCDQSIVALKRLTTMLQDMIPPVLLDRPASVDEEDFIRKS